MKGVPYPQADSRQDGRPSRPIRSEAKLIEVLKVGGGHWTGSQRSLASSINLERSATNQLLARMANQRLIAVQTTARGAAIGLAS